MQDSSVLALHGPAFAFAVTLSKGVCLNVYYERDILLTLQHFYVLRRKVGNRS